MKHKKKSKEKKQTKKILQYIEEDDRSRLRSYAKKHHIDLGRIRLENDRNLLHLAAQLGSAKFLRYFLKKGVDSLHVDVHGNLPLHAATEYAQQGHREAYTDIILPLVKANPESLDICNADGVTPRVLLQEFKSKVLSDSESDTTTTSEGSEDVDVDDTSDWHTRLAEELLDEHGEQSDVPLYETGNGSTDQETWDQWADRIHHEHRKRQYSSPYTPKPGLGTKKSAREKDASNDSGKRPRVSGPKQKAFDENMAKLREETIREQQSRKNILYRMRIARYEKLCCILFGESVAAANFLMENNESRTDGTNVTDPKLENLLGDSSEKLTFADIPWPLKKPSENSAVDVEHDKIVYFLFEGIAKESKDYEKYLKIQQRRWHPDRFSQKCGSRLDEENKESIMSMVTKISQLLNKLSENLK